MTAAAAPARFTPRPGPSFAGAVRSELLKLRRQALTWVFVALTGAAAVLELVTVLTDAVAKPQLETRPQIFYASYLGGTLNLFDTAAGVFLLVAAARLVGMEYGGGTIRVVLARGTARLQLLLAQLAALALAGVLLLIGFAILAAAILIVVVQAWHGSLAPLTSLPSQAVADTGSALVVALTSMASCILIGAAAAAVGRSLAFAVAAAMSFFPADNFGTIVMSLLQRTTGQEVWPRLTQWFLGPSLNQLSSLLTGRRLSVAYVTPLVPVDAAHVWGVVGVWALVFLAAAVVLTWRRDVLE